MLTLHVNIYKGKEWIQSNFQASLDRYDNEKSTSTYRQNEIAHYFRFTNLYPNKDKR